MIAEKKLDLAILWHMHQPDFRDHATGEFAQPWVYLHAIKDYSDMAAHLEAHPGVRVTLNFTPVLLDQLEDYSDQFSTGQFRDPLLRLLAQPHLEQVGPVERNLALAACFKANRQKLIDPYPAYKRLLEFARLAQEQGDAGASYLSAQYLSDLLSWYHLSWMGETVRRQYPVLPALIAKAHGFSHDDRMQLLHIIAHEVRQVIPRYRTLFEAGRIELTTTPEYHPIGPLLLSFESALEAAPGSPLPQSTHYPGGDERARAQTEAAQQSHARRFGRQPRGMWPAEGAVSSDFANLLAEAGFEWIASGEGVLVHTLKEHGDALSERPQYLYRPYRLEKGQNTIVCFFRDDRLSDLIGFEYAKWHGKDAAEHFVAALSDIANGVTDQQRPVVSVILDGENAWEYYPYNGYYFLDELYGALEGHGEIATTTFTQLLDEKREATPLPALVAGSWVYGNLATWIGSADKNRAWDLLCAAKQSFDAVSHSGRLEGGELKRARRQLADCEASDWCWWFGDYNPAESVMAFDALFRSKLRHLYGLLKLPAPAELNLPVSRGKADSEAVNAMRRAS
ncbi:MAG TPA: glycoside hydrolase family 57 protein [Burkholderiales bacterium]|nr:glycoside hydrolase family 57 protein [Burkholderiales bacterium]